MNNNILTYKGCPLVRSGNKIFYGDAKDKYILVLVLFKVDKETGLPAKVLVQIRATDASGEVVREGEKTCLGEAFKLGLIWLNYFLTK